MKLLNFLQPQLIWLFFHDLRLFFLKILLPVKKVPDDLKLCLSKLSLLGKMKGIIL